jgi:tRNA(Ile2) C34 agmatinyltransferase TiaS
MEVRIEMTTQRDESEAMTVQVTLRPWRVCARCGHAWKSRATHGRPRCRACEARLRHNAQAMSAALMAGSAR